MNIAQVCNWKIRYYEAPKQWILVLLLLMGANSVNAQGFSEESMKTRHLQTIQKLFFEDEARGLLAYYQSNDDQERFTQGVESLSLYVQEYITQKNRSKILLHVMRVLNTFHDEKKEVRFAILKHLSLKQLYDLIFLWRQAIYTSSFNGVFDLMTSKIMVDTNKKSFFKLLKENRFEGINAVIESASAYNRILEFLSFFDSQQLRELMSIYFKKMDSTKNFYYAIAWIEVMLKTKDKKLLLFMKDLLSKKSKQSTLDQNVYEHNYDTEYYEDREKYYDVLSSMGKLNSRDFYRIMNESYTAFYHQKTLGKGDIFLSSNIGGKKVKSISRFSTISNESLRFYNRDSIQRHFYYGDSDGWATWVAFLRKHKRSEDDQVFEFKNYVKIVRSNHNFLTNLVIYANKPGKQRNAQIEIENAIQAEGDNFHIFVHRGHSYHLHRGLEKITEFTKIAILGSCGAYNDLHSLLNRSLDIHAIISKGKGTYWVNRAILDVLNQEIALGNDIVWSEFREKVVEVLVHEHHIKDRVAEFITIFDDYYVLPNENVALRMLNTAIQSIENTNSSRLVSIQ
ncbi:hypothetical protein MJH12_04140 [bacterium]|nr:hypothetical protein [bacterium]